MSDPLTPPLPSEISELNTLLPNVCRIAYEAGQQISHIYQQNHSLEIEQKTDGSPVTVADKMADQFICQQLTQLTPTIPLVTEESVAKVPFKTRQAWSTYWLVDPLDGTKEFIGRTDEYSVNIALIHNHHPVLGVVYGPELGNCYFGYQNPMDSHDKTAAKIAGLLPNSEQTTLDWLAMVKQARLTQTIKVADLPKQQGQQPANFKVAVSRRHGGTLQRFMAQLGHHTTVKMGSALKTCLVAEGKVDVYPRFGPTSLWDTGASQCILEVAGGAVLNAAGHPLEYVQTDSLLNPFFMAVSHADYPWPKFPEIL